MGMPEWRSANKLTKVGHKEAISIGEESGYQQWREGSKSFARGGKRGSDIKHEDKGEAEIQLEKLESLCCSLQAEKKQILSVRNNIDLTSRCSGLAQTKNIPLASTVSPRAWSLLEDPSSSWLPSWLSSSW
ncbi:hypothetical protein HPP92_024822 [Vanilla planifolia]|uniref:Uncharacterized protein n=1 Tax=Vanilla planifolia TaxID=51239 RepID=A0A835U9T2_VANPL|nr:hypothetical protein HPP92_024822 [Vanilla planifolia]